MNVILVCGLNGSGKTTLGRELAKTLDFKFLNDEDYYFLESENPFSKSRTDEEVREFVASRTTEKIEKWLDTFSCRVIKLDGTKPITYNVEFIRTQL